MCPNSLILENTIPGTIQSILLLLCLIGGLPPSHTVPSSSALPSPSLPLALVADAEADADDDADAFSDEAFAILDLFTDYVNSNQINTIKNGNCR